MRNSITIAILLGLLWLALPVSAQPGQGWQHRYDSGIKTRLGKVSPGFLPNRYFITGAVDLPAVSVPSDVLLAKMDMVGNILPIRAYDHVDGCNDVGREVEQSQINELVIVGHLECLDSTGLDGLIMTLDTAGNRKWQARVGGTNQDQLFATEVNADTTFTSVGYTRSFGAFTPSKNAMVHWSFNNGAVQLIRVYATMMDEELFDLVRLPDSSLVAVGYTTTQFGPFPAERNVLVMRIDQWGNAMWTKVVDLEHNDVALGVDMSQGGMTVGITGYSDSLSGARLPFIMEMDLLGNVLWANTYDDQQHRASEAHDIRWVPAGGWVIGGGDYNPLTAFLMETNPMGMPNWQWWYQGELIRGLTNTFTGDIIAVGEANTGALGTELFAMRADPGGQSDTLCPDLLVIPMILPYPGDTIPVFFDQTPIERVDMTFYQDNSATYLQHNLCPTVDLDAELEAAVEVYPNPFQSSLKIRFPEALAAEFQLELLDLQGRVVLHRKGTLPASREVEVQTDELAEGIYLIRVAMGNSTFHRKLIKR